MNRYDLSGRHAVITGGGGGIGLAVARHMLEAGARVTLWDVYEAALSRAAMELACVAGSHLAGTCDSAVNTRVVDVTNAASVNAACEALVSVTGRIDVLVNSAGVLGEVKPVWNTDPDEFQRVLHVNLFGTYLVTREIVSRMRVQIRAPLRGHVVNLSSIQGKEGMAQSAAYSASKAGVIALTKSVARDTALDGIMVTCVTPTAAETQMAHEISSERKADILSRIPMGRYVEVDEIARLILWLSSSDCSFSNGAVFDISGGRASY